MTSPATLRLMGLLVIVGMVAGCGAEPMAPGGAAAIVGTYRLDVEQSVRLAADLALAHDVDLCTAKTDGERAQARTAFENQIREKLQGGGSDRLTLRADGTWEELIERQAGDSPIRTHRYVGKWEVVGEAVTLHLESEDGQPGREPTRTRLVYKAGSLYPHPDVLRMLKEVQQTGHAAGYDPRIPYLKPVMTKD